MGAAVGRRRRASVDQGGCVACGCCSFTCPAKRHLTQSIKSMRAIVLNNRKKNA